MRARASNRESALSLAVRILEQEGVDRLSLNRLSEDMGVTIRTIYYHFENRGTLLKCVAVEGARQLINSLDLTLSWPPGGARLDSAASAYLDFVRLRPRLYWLLCGNRGLLDDPAVRMAEAAAFDALRSALASSEVFEAGQVDSLASAIWTIGSGMAASINMGFGGQSPPHRSVVAIQRGAQLLLSQISTNKE